MGKKAGRPKVLQDDFYLRILQEFETLSFNDIAKLHKVTRNTAIRWVRKGKEIKMLYDKQKSNE